MLGSLRVLLVKPLYLILYNDAIIFSEVPNEDAFIFKRNFI